MDVQLAALEAKLCYDGDGYMVVGGVIAAEVIVHLTAADMHIDYGAALLIEQSLKARRYGDLVPGRSYSLRMLNNHTSLPIANWCVCVCGRCVCVCGRCVCMFVARVGVCMCVFGRVLVVGNASMIDLLLYEIGNEE